MSARPSPRSRGWRHGGGVTSRLLARIAQTCCLGQGPPQVVVDGGVGGGHGFGLCAVKLRRDGSFIGFIGLNVPSFDAPFTPCVEIGWRLAADCWGQGLATEGAHAIVRYGFETLGLEELVSFTVPANARSRRVIEKLGMTHDPDDDFDHPRLPAGHPLRRHVLYRLNRSGWSSGFVNK
jgi:RimJ/RimL family protein N-acetyltransferase